MVSPPLPKSATEIKIVEREWGGSATEEMFWLDFDSDGLGSGDGYSLCNGLDLPGWVTNNDDSDDNCASNYHDECGVCDGDNSSCSDCAGVPNGDSWESDCGCVAADNDGNDCDDCFGTPNGSAWDSDCGYSEGSQQFQILCYRHPSFLFRLAFYG